MKPFECEIGKKKRKIKQSFAKPEKTVK